MQRFLEAIGFFAEERRNRVTKDQFGPYEHTIASSIGGAITAFVVTPLDVAKTRLQSQNSKLYEKKKWLRHSHHHLSKPPQFRGTIDAFARISRTEGVLALWRGLSPTLLMNVPATTMYFTLYEAFKRYTQSKDIGIWSPILSGTTARSITVLFASPLDMFRTNIQSHGRDVGSLDIFIKIHHSGNLNKLWVGLRPTLWRDVPFSAIYWTVLEYSRAAINRTGFNFEFLTNFICGAGAGAIAAVATMPFDVVKTRMQMSIDLTTKVVNRYENKTVVSIIREISEKEGFLSIYKGALPRASKVAPACAIMIATYEHIKSLMSKKRVDAVQ